MTLNWDQSDREPAFVYDAEEAERERVLESASRSAASALGLIYHVADRIGADREEYAEAVLDMMASRTAHEEAVSLAQQKPFDPWAVPTRRAAQ